MTRLNFGKWQQVVANLLLPKSLVAPLQETPKVLTTHDASSRVSTGGSQSGRHVTAVGYVPLCPIPTWWMSRVV